MPTTDSKFWLDVAQWVLTGLLAAIVWLRKPGEDAQAEAKRTRSLLATSHRELSTRLTVLEERYTQVPSRVELAQLQGELRTVQMQMEGQNQQLLVIQQSVYRIEQFLIERRRHDTIL